jgi:hypothetical protein
MTKLEEVRKAFHSLLPIDNLERTKGFTMSDLWWVTSYPVLILSWGTNV